MNPFTSVSPNSGSLSCAEIGGTLVARGDQLAFAAEVVRFGFAPDEFALEVERLPGKPSGRSMAPRFAIKVENIRTRRKVTYYGGPGRAWVAEILADLIAGEFGYP